MKTSKEIVEKFANRFAVSAPRAMTVLVVDDSAWARVSVASQVNVLGCVPICVKSLDEALYALEQVRPALILIDDTLGEYRGDQCATRIKAHPKHAAIPIVLMSEAAHSNETAERCTEAGIDDVILKPIVIPQLRRTLAGLIRPRHATATFASTPATARQIRSAARVSFSSILYYRERNSEGAEWLTGHTHDLCPGGVFIRTVAPLPHGASLELRLRAPSSSRAIECLGHVAWVNAPFERACSTHPLGMGIRFMDLSEQQSGALREVWENLAVTRRRRPRDD